LPWVLLTDTNLPPLPPSEQRSQIQLLISNVTFHPALLLGQ